ncbi:hypothetical protein OS670_00245 [Pseudomonadaceae bacterium T75]|nr:hypothetical protein OS670_00245 [Pseudomonadaceae bacterium T75]
MLIGDQVLCDCCGNDMGKLMAQPAPQSDLLPDLGLPPYFTSCPDCSESQFATKGTSNE